MSFTLRVFVMGLVALVPDGGSLTLVLQNAEEHHHFPVVLYEDRNVVSTDGSRGLPSKIDPLDRLDDVKKDEFGWYRLQGERISLSGGKSGGVAFSPGRNSSWYQHIIGAVPRRPGALRDFSWVAPMEDIFGPDLGTIASRHLASPSASEVSGVWELEGVSATVSTFSLVDDNDRQHIRSHTFKKTEDSLSVWDTKQAWADIVLLRIDIQSDHATLVLKQFGADAAKKIKLRPYRGEETVDVILGNFFVGGGGEVNHFDLHCLLSVKKVRCPESPQPGARSVRRQGNELDRDFLPRLVGLIEDLGDEYPASALSNRLLCTGEAAFLPPPQ